MSGNRKRKETLIKILLEIPAVIIAVLLALGLNSWKQDRDDKAMAQKSLQNIIFEIQNNLSAVKESIEDNDQARPYLDSTMARIDSGAQDIDFDISYDHSILSSAAWESANLTGAINHLDTKLVIDIADLYRIQDIYMNMGENFFLKMSSVEFNSDDNIRAVVKSNQNLIGLSENICRALIGGYEEFLKTQNAPLEAVNQEADSLSQ
ncbi:MAG: hypothetical protein AAFX87_08675 [Bacteroidota bacterium]